MPLPSIIETKASKYINHQHAIAQSKCKPKALRLNAPYFSWLEAAMRCKYNVTFCRLTHSKHTNTWCKCGIPRQDMPKQEQTMQSWNMLVRKAMLLLRQRPLCQTSQFHAGLPSIPSWVASPGAQTTRALAQKKQAAASWIANPQIQKDWSILSRFRTYQDNPRQSKTLFNDFLLVSNTSLTSIDDLLLAHAGNCEKGR